MIMRLILCCVVVGAVRRRADCTPATCVGDDDANYDRDLFREATVVRSFDDERRYLTVVGLGASYGGFSMNYLNGNAPKDMFCALVNHDGLFDMRSGYWSTEELFFMEKEFNGPPCAAAASDPASPYNVASPALKVAEWRTPTLVIQGDKDYCLVTSEAISTFTALQRQGVASELLFFPDENHHCLNPQNSLVWHDAVLAWCRRWT